MLRIEPSEDVAFFYPSTGGYYFLAWSRITKMYKYFFSLASARYYLTLFLLKRPSLNTITNGNERESPVPKD
jgi:hypothetical protein